MIRAALVLLAVLLLVPAAGAQDRILGGLNQHSVSLTTDFAGSELFIYGGFEKGRPEDNYDVIVTITGPSEPVIVRQKQRRFGIWINGRGVQIDTAPSFYAVASTQKFAQTVSATDDLRYRIGLDRIVRLIDAPAWVEDREEYRLALIRLREQEGLYAFLPNAVTVNDFVFETRIKLPANLIEGDYSARIFLIKDKQVLDVYEDRIEVRRAGIGRWIYTYAQEYPALYGVASILIALIAGWLASAFFRTFFPN